MDSAAQVSGVSHVLSESDEQHLRRLVEAGRIDDATRDYCRSTRQSYSAGVLWVNRIANAIARAAGIDTESSLRAQPALNDQ